MSPRVLLLVALALPAFTATHARAGSLHTLDRFSYPTDVEAARVWVARDGAPRVLPEKPGAAGLRFPCPFLGDRDRFYWDRSARLDLSEHSTFELDLSCARPEALRSLGLYFKSGNGWYVALVSIPEAGRQSLLLSKADFSTEGKPAGWRQIETIRISPWKGAAVDTEVVAYALHAYSSSITLVQGTRSAPNDAERNMSRRVTQRIARWLTDQTVPHNVIRDEDVEAGALRGTRVAVLCYNPNPPDAEVAALRDFLEQGGRLIVFYSASEPLARLMNFRLGEYKRSELPGAWSSFSFDRPDALHVPPRVHQNSLNIRPVFPLNDSAEVVAHWENADGKRTGDPAWTFSPQGAWMSHIPLEGDGHNQQHMLLSLLGRFDPGVWRIAARRTLERAGKIGPYRDLPDTMRGLRAAAAKAQDEERVMQLRTRAALVHQQMLARFKNSAYAQVLDGGDELYHLLLEAYARSQSPRDGELRGVWEHDGVGWYPGNWEKTCALLAEHGLNALFPNMLWGGLAHYPSQVLPHSNTLKRFGDQVGQCLAAARRHGLELHVWDVCWNLTTAPPEFVADMKRQGRMQVSADGETLPWLCPSHPENVALTVNSLAELVRAYAVDGIHLDYIRFPGPDSCYCATSRAAFEKWSGRPVIHWPKDAANGGSRAAAYRKFRVDQINLVLRAIHQQVRPIRPGLKISAAVFSTYPDCTGTVGQDWMYWLQQGYVDFVAPMNYTTSSPAFSAMVHRQMGYAGKAGRIAPGLGVTSNESDLRPDQVLDQIHILRQQGARGFVLFDLSHTLRDEVLPAMSQGATRP